MRDIKFRGMNYDGDVLIGDLLTYDAIPYILPADVLFRDVFMETREGIILNNIYFSVNPDTVGQYTGFNDKNGKEIYEGMNVIGKWANNETLYKFKIGFKRGSFVMINEAGLYFNLSRAFDYVFVNEGFTLEIVENE